MLDIVCWLWRPTLSYRSQFAPKHVNILRSMVERCYPHEHRFSCITDQTEGFDPRVRLIPIWNDHSNRQSIYGPDTPACYRRLKAYDLSMREIIGPRFVSIDLDVVLTGDVSTVWDRPEDFVIWGEKQRRTPYNGSMWMMNAGCRQNVWTRFNDNPELAVRRARGAGFYGSDQAWLNYILGPNEVCWTRMDGVYSYRQHLRADHYKLPPHAKIVFFEGLYDPWSPVTQLHCPWIADHYR